MLSLCCGVRQLIVIYGNDSTYLREERVRYQMCADFSSTLMEMLKVAGL